jgi:hypothetical protein
MDSWPYGLTSYSPEEVRVFCVQDVEWQRHRLGMKGIPTRDKLHMLELWAQGRNAHGVFRSSSEEGGEDLRWGFCRATDVQISNYLNALKRGGQLDMNLRVKR